MKLSEFVCAVSVLDSFTIRHMRQWAERFAPSNEEPSTICAKMVVYLEGLDAEDLEYLIGEGWTVVFDAMQEAGV